MFTTNYDCGIEQYYQENDVSLETGFEPNPLDLRPHLRIGRISGGGGPQLVHLHSSISWYVKNGEIMRFETPPSATYGGESITEGLLLLPAQKKDVFDYPFMHFFNLLHNSLRNADTWIVTGFSFNDVVISSIFEDCWNESKTFVLIDPNAMAIMAIIASWKSRKKLKGLILPFGMEDPKLSDQMIGLSLPTMFF